MNNKIDKKYFWGELEITGLSVATKEDELNKFIAKYQKKYLKEMFNDVFVDEIPTDILSLLVDEETITSPIANFVYFFWQNSHAVVQTNAGTKALNTQNTQVQSPYFKMCAAWNEMVLKNEEIYKFMYEAETEDYDFANDIYPYYKEYLFRIRHPWIIE